ncbi:hypothetical protein ABZP36_034154 [Zizania latifolia]
MAAPSTRPISAAGPGSMALLFLFVSWSSTEVTPSPFVFSSLVIQGWAELFSLLRWISYSGNADNYLRLAASESESGDNI